MGGGVGWSEALPRWCGTMLWCTVGMIIGSFSGIRGGVINVEACDEGLLSRLIIINMYTRTGLSNIKRFFSED